jgi:DNA polymerase III epsilon subunit-like protein
MIVVDIETTGKLLPHKRGIWQIGAIELENPNNFFLEEARIDDSDEIDEEALLVIGKDEPYLRDKNKQSQKQLLEKFFEWTKKIKNKELLCHNTQYDYAFIYIKAEMYGLEAPIPHRCFDLHTIAQVKFYQLNNEFKLKIKDNDLTSDFGLSNILTFCGIEDKRIHLEMGTNKVKKDGTPHNGLEDAKLEAECFSRIVYGKNLLQEFSENLIPDYLKK